jgi:hypothetical protein
MAKTAFRLYTTAPRECDGPNTRPYIDNFGVTAKKEVLRVVSTTDGTQKDRYDASRHFTFTNHHLAVRLANHEVKETQKKQIHHLYHDIEYCETMGWEKEPGGIEKKARFDKLVEEARATSHVDLDTTGWTWVLHMSGPLKEINGPFSLLVQKFKSFFPDPTPECGKEKDLDQPPQSMGV